LQNEHIILNKIGHDGGGATSRMYLTPHNS